MPWETVTCKMLTGRSAVSCEWELEVWELSWKARSPSAAGSSCHTAQRQDPPTPVSPVSPVTPAAAGSARTGPQSGGRAGSGPRWLLQTPPRSEHTPSLYTSCGWGRSYLRTTARSQSDLGGLSHRGEEGGWSHQRGGPGGLSASSSWPAGWPCSRCGPSPRSPDSERRRS